MLHIRFLRVLDRFIHNLFYFRDRNYMMRKPLERILTANPEFKKKFTSRLELPVFINDELVTFGQTYAKENGYKLSRLFL